MASSQPRNIIISFLGKARKQENALLPDHPHLGYSQVTYQFENGFQYETSLFPLALLRYLEAQQAQPDALYILGTDGSSWASLGDVLTDIDDSELQWLSAMEEVENDGDATQEMLDRIPDSIKNAWGGLAFHPVIIPACTTREEQEILLRLLCTILEAEDRVTLDITHAFRHLSNITSFMLNGLHWERGISVDRMLYGALEMVRNGHAHVIDISYGPETAKLGALLGTYRNTGRFKQLAEFLPDQANLVREVDYLSNIGTQLYNRNRYVQLNKALSAVTDNDNPVLHTVMEELKEELTWQQSGNNFDRLLKRCKRHIDQERYQQALVILVELPIFYVAYTNNPDISFTNYNESSRTKSRRELFNTYWCRGSEENVLFTAISKIRNGILHMTAVDDSTGFNKIFFEGQRIGKWMNDALVQPEVLKTLLSKLYKNTHDLIRGQYDPPEYDFYEETAEDLQEEDASETLPEDDNTLSNIAEPEGDPDDAPQP